MEGENCNSQLTLWASVDYSPESNLEATREKKKLISVKLNPQWTAKDVQGAILKALCVGVSTPASANTIVKVRDGQGALLPLTPSALHSSPVQPLNMEICASHHNVNAEESCVDAVPPTFKTAVEAIIMRFEKRIEAAEKGLENLEGRQAAMVEEQLRGIQETLAYMTKRLDHTSTPVWVTDQT